MMKRYTGSLTLEISHAGNHVYSVVILEGVGDRWNPLGSVFAKLEDLRIAPARQAQIDAMAEPAAALNAQLDAVAHAALGFAMAGDDLARVAELAGSGDGARLYRDGAAARRAWRRLCREDRRD